MNNKKLTKINKSCPKWLDEWKDKVNSKIKLEIPESICKNKKKKKKAAARQ